MKEKLKGLVMGVLATTMVFATVPAFADATTKTVSITYKNIKMYVDGALFTPKSGSEPFIMNGTVYLPIRAVGEAIDKDVNWNSSTNTAYLGKMPNSSNPDAWLTDLTQIQGDSVHLTDCVDNIDVVHEKNIFDRYFKAYSHEESEYKYLINGDYSRFKGSFIVSGNHKNTRSEAVFKIYGDDYLLYTSPKMEAGVLPTDFNIDISGVKSLKIVQEQNAHGYEFGYIFGIAEPGLYK